MLGYVILGGLAVFGIYLISEKGEFRTVNFIERIPMPPESRLQDLEATAVTVKTSDMEKVFGPGDRPARPASAEDRMWSFSVGFKESDATALVVVDWDSDVREGRLTVSTKGGDEDLARAFARALTLRASRLPSGSASGRARRRAR